MKHECNEKGQSTVEFALLIPVLAIFLLLIVQVAVVVRGYVLVANASRSAARELSVNENQAYARSVAQQNAPGSTVEISRPSKSGEYLSVTVNKKIESPIPVLGVMFPELTVSSSTSMRVEK